MKKHIKIMAVIFSLLGMTACNQHLNLAPEDYFADGNYWQNEAQVDNFMTASTLNYASSSFSFSA